jgi:hypothetical protein
MSEREREKNKSEDGADADADSKRRPSLFTIVPPKTKRV